MLEGVYCTYEKRDDVKYKYERVRARCPVCRGKVEKSWPKGRKLAALTAEQAEVYPLAYVGYWLSQCQRTDGVVGSHRGWAPSDTEVFDYAGRQQWMWKKEQASNGSAGGGMAVAVALALLGRESWSFGVFLGGCFLVIRCDWERREQASGVSRHVGGDKKMHHGMTVLGIGIKRGGEQMGALEPVVLAGDGWAVWMGVEMK